jgi:hypothetical protein
MLAKICLLRAPQTKASQEFSFHIAAGCFTTPLPDDRGLARIRDLDILYRSALYPLSDDGITIDHVPGAANHRPLRKNENSITPFVRTKWL